MGEFTPKHVYASKTNSFQALVEPFELIKNPRKEKYCAKTWKGILDIKLIKLKHTMMKVYPKR